MLMQPVGKKWMPVLVFVVAMGYLAICHIYRMVLDYGGYTLDITGYVGLYIGWHVLFFV